jgi:hypothetical protein
MLFFDFFSRTSQETTRKIINAAHSEAMKLLFDGHIGFIRHLITFCL